MNTSSIKRSRRFSLRNLESMPSLLIMCVFIVYPLATLLIQIVLPNVFSANANFHFTLLNVSRVFRDPINVISIVNSIWMGVVGAILSVIIGTITAFGAHNARGPAKSFINTCVWIIFFAPSFVIASGWVVLLQGGGIIPELFNLSPNAFNWFFSPAGLFLIMGLRYFPFAHFAMTQSIQNIGPEYIRAGRILGAKRSTIFFKIWLRLLAPALLAGASIAFAEGFGDYGLASVITPNLNIPLVSFQIYSALFELPVDFSSAAVLSLVVILVTATAIILQFWWLRRKSYNTISGTSWDKVTSGQDLQKWVVWVTYVILFIGLILPLGGTLIQSFWKNSFQGFAASNWTFANYISALGVGEQGLASMLRTAVYALLTSIVVMVLGLYISTQMTFNQSVVSRAINAVTMATIAIPGIVLGCGYVFGWNALYLKPLHLAIFGTSLCLGLAYVAVHLPYAIRLQLSAMLQISPNLLSAAKILGANRRIVLRAIVLPLVMETAVSTFLISFTGTMFELPAASMLYPPGHPPISVLINHLFSDSNWAPGSALSIVGMLVVFGSYAFGNFLLRRFLGGQGLRGAWGAGVAQQKQTPMQESANAAISS